MLRTVSAPAVAPSTEINRKELPQTQEIAFCPFGLALRGIWGNDAAIELAARSGKKLRVCEYKIKGTVKTTGVDIAVLVDAVTKRR